MPVEKVRCACGCNVGKFYLRKHQLTKKHLKLMDNMLPMTLSEVMKKMDNMRQMTLSEVMKKMDDLEEKIDDISSGEYLLECNRLKSIYDRLRRSDLLASVGVN
jgi:hypothetical protein